MKSDLGAIARECDRSVAEARGCLVSAIRDAARAGMTQSEIAQAVGRSQPEVSRLLRFHGATPLGRRLRLRRQQVLDTVDAVGGRRVRVFGSVARGEDGEGSDVDLVFHPSRPIGLLALERLSSQLSELLDVPVDVVPDTAVDPTMAERIASESVLL